jgi:TatD DNase family protein
MLKYNYIVDSHCHLDLIEQKEIKLSEIVDNAIRNNVKILLTISTKISTIDQILNYTKQENFIYASLGIHPCNVLEEERVDAEKIIKICEENNKIIGIGETGLDYYHNDSVKNEQKISFLQHIKASQENNLPVIIHNRNSDKDMIDILKTEQKNKKFPALLHCFSSSQDLARTALDLDMMISISGIVTFKNANQLQELVKFLPLESILLETDSPYLAPTPNRGKINQPSYLKHTMEFIAQLKNISQEKLINQTTDNFFKIFSKANSSTNL